IGETLQALNYRVLHASNGREALGICERRGSEIDLILSDVVMPDMGGWDLFHALKARRPEARLALMTGYPLGSETRELLDQQQVTWLHKPFTTENVGRAVRRAMALKV
ncbi:MAG: response regulator, partial [Anaerolineales bacterium]